MSLTKWDDPTSRGSVLSTELNALGNDARSAAGGLLDNLTNKDQYAWAKLTVDFVSAPSAGAYCQLFMVKALDGTNYEQGSDTVEPAQNISVGSFPLLASTAAQHVTIGPFLLPPYKVKFILLNKSGQAFPASGSLVEIFTSNDEAL